MTLDDEMYIYKDIVNMSEELIALKLKEIWKTNKYCTCDKCRRDVYTYALNRMQPHYVDSTQGKLFLKLAYRDKGENIELIKIVSNAVEVIGNNPQHEKE